ncbi:MAG TPA: hypothetical protein VF086_08740, partial [Propionibacteriaceae bacterium]
MKTLELFPPSGAVPLAILGRYDLDDCLEFLDVCSRVSTRYDKGRILLQSLMHKASMSRRAT